MWGFWCYPFENFLGYTKRFVHAKRAPEKGFMFGAQVLRMLPPLEQKEFEQMQDNLADEQYFCLYLFLFIPVDLCLLF